MSTALGFSSCLRSTPQGDRLVWVCLGLALQVNLGPWQIQMAGHPAAQSSALDIFILITWFMDNLDSLSSEITNCL